MANNNDSSASGYLTDAMEGISRTFTDVDIIATSEVNVVAKAKRYGRWWPLKGETTKQQRRHVAMELTEAVAYIHSKGIPLTFSRIDK